MASQYHVGDVAVVTMKFYVASALTDPTDITLTATHALGLSPTQSLSLSGATVTRSSLGVYTANVTCAAAGRWDISCVSTGAAAGAEPTYLYVDP